MVYRTTVKHSSIAIEVAASAQRLAAETRQVMEAKLAPFLREGETMPDAGLLQELLGRFLEAQSDDLLAADERYTTEVRDHHLLQRRYLDAMAAVRRRLRDVRYALDRLFGVETCVIVLGTRDFTTRNPGMLSQLARSVAGALRQPEYRFEPDPSAGLAASSSRLAEELDAEAAALEQIAGRQLEEQRKKRQIGLHHKETRLASTKTAVSHAVIILRGFYNFAGSSYHAQRIRPQPRKSAAATEPPPEEGPGGASPD